MLNSIFSGTTIPVVEQVVNFSQARHNVLAGNIANLDTPGYHARDLSTAAFQDRLKRAIVERDAAPSGFSPGDATSADPLAGLGGAVNDFLRHDDSTVNLETQVAEIAKNQLQHSMAISILTSQFRLLQAAIGERA